MEFKDLEEYSELLTKQFVSRLENLHKDNIELKISLDKLHTECTAKPKENYGPRIEVFKKSIAAF
jgi:hypothetical protein